ncbi:hypothetical protein [Clostridium sp. UBA7339]|uniref:hypothetical protein n=1 Tax=Clostridium sp. UBA7339 TaxID=1946376 RepID=UPI0039C8AFCA
MGKNFEDVLKSDYKNNEGNDLNSMELKKPIMLMEGDKVATISLSWGGAGDENILWTSEHLPWEIENKFIPRKVNKNMEYELLQGSGKVQGHLIGGCIDVLEMLKGTEVWPSSDKWKDGILFLETSEDKPEPTYVEYWLRNYGAQGILQNINGIVFGKPYDNVYYNEYKEAFIKVIRDELKLKDLPILFNVNFGHTAPMITIPYGAKAEIDCEEKGFSIIESGVRK